MLDRLAIVPYIDCIMVSWLSFLSSRAPECINSVSKENFSSYFASSLFLSVSLSKLDQPSDSRIVMIRFRKGIVFLISILLCKGCICWTYSNAVASFSVSLSLPR